MKKLLKLFLLAIIIQGCAVDVENPCNLPQNTWAELKKEDSLINVPVIQNQNAEWMKLNYDESSIFVAKHETYRFQKHCSGNENFAKIVRIEKTNEGDYHAVIKEFKGPSESPLAKGAKNSFVLSPGKWEAVKSELEKVNFWTNVSSCNDRLLHGCTWSIEAYHPDKNKCAPNNYHQISGCHQIDSALLDLYDVFDQLNNK